MALFKFYGFWLIDGCIACMLIEFSLKALYLFLQSPDFPQVLMFVVFYLMNVNSELLNDVE